MNLSTRARNLMKKYRITDDGLNHFHSAKQIQDSLRNCGRETATELWRYRQYLQAKQIRLTRIWDRIPHGWYGDWSISEVMYQGSDGRRYQVTFKRRCNSRHPDVIPPRIKAETLHRFIPAKYDHVIGFGTFYL